MSNVFVLNLGIKSFFCISGVPLKPYLAPKTYREECVSSCSDKPNGDYQSCETCNGYVTCSNGESYERPCPAKLVWDDVKKRCEATSTTCDMLFTKSHPAPVDLTLSRTQGRCVSNCKDMPDGYYQSCKTCNGYVFCSVGILYDGDCPAGLVWDDEKKRCEWYSTTCDMLATKIHPAPVDLTLTRTRSRCVEYCGDMPDGHYQSCKTCYGYVSCSGKILYDRDCPADLVWDDVKKRCEWSSTTCDISSTTSPSPTTSTTSPRQQLYRLDPLMTGVSTTVGTCLTVTTNHVQPVMVMCPALVKFSMTETVLPI